MSLPVRIQEWTQKIPRLARAVCAMLASYRRAGRRRFIVAPPLLGTVQCRRRYTLISPLALRRADGITLGNPPPYAVRIPPLNLLGPPFECSKRGHIENGPMTLMGGTQVSGTEADLDLLCPVRAYINSHNSGSSESVVRYCHKGAHEGIMGSSFYSTGLTEIA